MRQTGYHQLQLAGSVFPALTQNETTSYCLR
uniref:Uncharacterized protein n=1 Tax=Anguilla anguilla TaxID=7936 RepID=A0A0E9U3W6_ANGAN